MMNNTLKKIVLISAAVAAVSLGIAAVLFFTTGMFSSGRREGGLAVDESDTFSPAGIEEINLSTSSTDVLVGGSTGNSIEVRLHGTVHTTHPEAIPRLSALRRHEILEIATERKEGLKYTIGFYSDDLVLELGLPEVYRERLVVRTSSGDVKITDHKLSGLSVATSSGDIELRSIRTSSLKKESSSGDLVAEDLDADYSELISSSGDTQVQGLRGSARVKTSSGKIVLRYSEFDGDLEVRSSSGDVTLSLTEAAQFRLQARASSGDVTCHFPITVSGPASQMSRNTLVGVVKKGTHSVAVDSSSGDITIEP
jgi:lia operon protein LiaG